MLILSRAEVEKLLNLSELVTALEEGFKALSLGQLNIPPRNQAVAPKGVLVGMPAYMPDHYMSVKLVSVFHENYKQSIPNHQAVINLFDSETGTPVVFMDGEYITAMRTAAGAMVSIKHLARQNSKNLALIGAGVLGAAHLKMIQPLDSIDQVRIASWSYLDAQALAAQAANAQAVDSIQEAVANADVICLCTSSSEPVIEVGWLKNGAHVSSVGYRPPGGELPRELVAHSRVFVESRVAFSAPPVGCSELQGLAPELGTELGEVLLNRKPGRISEKEITVYKSMGHAMEDLVAANLVYQKALEQKMGKLIDL
jgi:alanine dehydrogenase